ncbi:hsp70 protein [Hirsutella rhossiliensis]|uniref:Hsp70 protein n=1 Tax=Hirsutella rhossiliensis TaxID=111463 RepID=A0A9P8SG55_9HYPO|nr:hsp70 protein [Hirsutella rhossiliensis]KAH0960784.1 hsp70 protein [Hirsutella rhossiliensis]
MAVSQTPPPLMLLLGAIFFLSSSVCAAGAVLGVDLGTEFIKAALVKPGIPLDIVLTKDSRRKETSAVAFKPLQAGPKEGSFPERFYGADAMALAPRFPGEVYPNLKTLLGLPIDDAVAREYASRHPALQLKSHGSRGTAAFKSSTFPPGEDAWMVEELLAMELQSIQKNAESAAGNGASVRSIVLTVPAFYTTEEKRAIQAAAELAGLKVLALISDGLAVGLNYATSRQFPNINEGAKPEYHLGRTVKDVGKFNKTFQEVQVLGSGWDRSLGGDDLNYLIMDDMISQFIASPSATATSITAAAVKSHGRAMAKLAKEAERVRHVLSANQNTHASFEGLYEDVDFKYKLTRTDFETMAAAHAERIGKVIKDAIEMSAIDFDSLTSIILHGGATRTPFVQKALEKAVGSQDKIRSNVNADEAAVFGAGFRAAELSPSFRVKEIRISEGPMYEAGLKWTASHGKQLRQRLWTANSPMGGPAKEMTFAEQNDFPITFYQQVGSEDREIKTMATKNLTATVAAMKDRYPTCEETDLAFKVAFELSSGYGEVQVAKANVECKAEVPEKEGFVDGVKNLFGFGKKEQQPLKDVDENKEPKASEGSEETLKDEAKSTASSSSSSTDAAKSPAPSEAEKKTEEAEAEAKPEAKKKETVSIPVQVVLENAGLPSLTKAELIKVKDRLKSFAASDKARIVREEALNQLEGFTYKARDLVEAESFISRSTEKERSKLSEKASEISEWLYEGGAEATKEELKAKLKVLQDLVAPVQTRIDEAEKRPELVSSLKTLLNQTSHFIGSLRDQISEFEKWQASASVASSAGSSTTSSAPSESPSSEFDGLEDQDSTSQTKSKADKAQETPEPVQPLYKKEEVDGIEALYKSTSKWLSELEARQEALPLTAEPVLLSKDLAEKRQKLDKAGMELAVKGMKSFESKAKKASKSASKKKSKTKSAADANKTVKVGDGKVSDEELERVMEEIKKMEAAKEKKGGDKKVHDEL